MHMDWRLASVQKGDVSKGSASKTGFSKRRKRSLKRPADNKDVMILRKTDWF